MSWFKISVISFVFISLLIICLTFEVWAAAFLGLLFALSLNGPAEWIRSKWRMPSWTATLLVMLMVLTVLTGLGFVIGPPLVAQADEMRKELPAAMEKSLDWLENREWGRTVVQQFETLSGVSKHQLNRDGNVKDRYQVLGQDRTANAAQQQPLAAKDDVDSSETRAGADASDHAAAGGQADTAEQDSGEDNGNGNGNGDSKDDSATQTRAMVLAILKTLGKMLSVSAWAIMMLVVSIAVMLYVALDPEVYRRGILWLIPSHHEAVATLTMTRISITLQWWMLGRLASMLAVGLLTSLGMWLIGMPAPLALGALAGLLSFVPNIGPIVAALPGLLLAFPDGPWMFFSALGVYVVAQIVESNLITPLVDQYTVTTPPAMLIFTQVIMGVLAGGWGVVISTPLLVVAIVLTQQLYVRGYINKPIKGLGSTDDESPDGANENQQTRPSPLTP